MGDPYALQTSVRWTATHAKRIQQAFRGLDPSLQDAPSARGTSHRSPLPSMARVRSAVELETGDFMYRRILAEIAKLIPKRIRRFFGERFSDASSAERSGYLVWFTMGVVIGVPEIWAAISGDDFYWPTISTTVGHLQDRWPVVTLIPVVLIVGYGYSALRLRPATTALQADMSGITRTPQGRLTQSDVSLEQLAAGTSPNLGTSPFFSTPYFVSATLIVVAAPLAVSPSHNRFAVGYVLYSLIAIFWVVVPNVAAYWFKRDAPYTTLVVTISCLARRLTLAACLAAALLVVLLIHLAFYPWPARR